MARHIKTGELGEKLALDYFQKKGYVILEQNWRYSHWEVDIIASHNEILHFIEVKTRRTKTFGYPEDDVTKKKINNLINAAEEYVYLNPAWKRIQIDILAINLPKNEPVEYFLIEDVYV